MTNLCLGVLIYKSINQFLLSYFMFWKSNYYYKFQTWTSSKKRR